MTTVRARRPLITASAAAAASPASVQRTHCWNNRSLPYSHLVASFAEIMNWNVYPFYHHYHYHHQFIKHMSDAHAYIE